ncbi:hypothetical protein AU468_04210 [Alkalispirochaeta sphaeroplastigenens]|uniref:Tyrosine specific protein phosphatases domain-containing protein n=2 Tax=Alkalispirochaeta sphaeroplastigenens TaxID=1187066 RepID=A0A2S4JWX0_9SPIO|nr:hypothetical protein AU468_04210 [Alkalispirochaeta sphaeroplastigenens]
MRNWNNKLFMDAMPGRYSPLDRWIAEIAENQIDIVVCLASDGEIRKKSPAYAALREKKQILTDQMRLPVGDRGVVLKELPIQDFAAPAADETDQFWLLATELARRIDEGFRVFIHCAAGIGRTGLLAVAVLMMTGMGRKEALEEISRAGSGPETSEQKSLLEAGSTL